MDAGIKKITATTSSVSVGAATVLEKIPPKTLVGNIRTTTSDSQNLSIQQIKELLEIGVKIINLEINKYAEYQKPDGATFIMDLQTQKQNTSGTWADRATLIYS